MRSLSLLEVAEWVDGALIQGTPSDRVSRVSTDSRARIGIIAENPFDNRTELLIDAVRVRVHRPAAAR